MHWRYFVMLSILLQLFQMQTVKEYKLFFTFGQIFVILSHCGAQRTGVELRSERIRVPRFFGPLLHVPSYMDGKDKEDTATITDIHITTAAQKAIPEDETKGFQGLRQIFKDLEATEKIFSLRSGPKRIRCTRKPTTGRTLIAVWRVVYRSL